MVILAISLALIPSFFSSVSYNITGGLGGPSNSESKKAANIMQAQFPGSGNESSDNIIIVLQETSAYNNSVKNTVLSLNNTISRDKRIVNYTGESSVYALEYDLLTPSLPTLIMQVSSLASNITFIQGINQTSQLVYGVPATFVQVWQGVVAQLQAQNISDPYLANTEANKTVYKVTGNFSGNVESNEYYYVFFSVWNSTFQTLPSNTATTIREAFAINQSVMTFLGNPQVNNQTRQLVTAVSSGLNVKDWNQTSAISHTCWQLASMLISDATRTAFSGSPLFAVNSTSLEVLLSSLPQNANATSSHTAVEGIIASQSFLDYPYVPTKALTKNFVSPNNDTMIVILDFSSPLSKDSISRVKLDVQSSGLQNSARAVYVTGGSVVTRDVEDVFSPALTMTVGPGVVVSLLIVGLLFLSPVAALIPVLMGGVSIAVALSSIYLGIVLIGHGNLTFLTPTLTILLMLGLAVDYAVLQLRRTREERLQGKSIEESVGISVRWAGQAVLTAGVTVIAAYIIMAVVNVPILSSVGTAIALGVSILLVASLTLLPSLEIALGDRAFWPGIGKQTKTTRNGGQTRLRRVAERTLRRKVAVVAVISLLALGAFVITYSTPLGMDFLKLIPNFQSNQGLTVITNNLGSGTIAPTNVVVTTPTPITFGGNQFNQTLLNQLDQISNAAAHSVGVVSVVGPTRPFGSPFNYSKIENMPMPLQLQYESAMLSMIGKDNKTALIDVGLSNSSESSAAVTSLLQMEKNINKLSLTNGLVVYFGGSAQMSYDSESFISGLLPEVVVVLSAAVYVILFFQLRSAFTPLRLIFTILCSVLFSLATVSLVFYRGFSLPILDFAPLFVVVTMLGVGIDYDIFLVTRIREEVLNGKTDDEAIKTAIDRVWTTIFGLGLVLSTVFGSVLITGIAILQEIGLAVSAAVLIDVVVVILFFVPSLMGLAQKFNWWPYRISRNQQDKKSSR
jgi:RND superfamily putative drug exporter